MTSILSWIRYSEQLVVGKFPNNQNRESIRNNSELRSNNRGRSRTLRSPICIAVKRRLRCGRGCCSHCVLGRVELNNVCEPLIGSRGKSEPKRRQPGGNRSAWTDRPSGWPDNDSGSRCRRSAFEDGATRV